MKTLLLSIALFSRYVNCQFGGLGGGGFGGGGPGGGFGGGGLGGGGFGGGGLGGRGFGGGGLGNILGGGLGGGGRGRGGIGNILGGGQGFGGRGQGLGGLGGGRQGLGGLLGGGQGFGGFGGRGQGLGGLGGGRQGLAGLLGGGQGSNGFGGASQGLGGGLAGFGNGANRENTLAQLLGRGAGATNQQRGGNPFLGANSGSSPFNGNQNPAAGNDFADLDQNQASQGAGSGNFKIGGQSFSITDGLGSQFGQQQGQGGNSLSNLQRQLEQQNLGQQTPFSPQRQSSFGQQQQPSFGQQQPSFGQQQQFGTQQDALANIGSQPGLSSSQGLSATGTGRFAQVPQSTKTGIDAFNDLVSQGNQQAQNSVDSNFRVPSPQKAQQLTQFVNSAQGIAPSRAAGASGQPIVHFGNGPAQPPADQTSDQTQVITSDRINDDLGLGTHILKDKIKTWDTGLKPVEDKSAKPDLRKQEKVHLNKATYDVGSKDQFFENLAQYGAPPAPAQQAQSPPQYASQAPQQYAASSADAPQRYAQPPQSAQPPPPPPQRYQPASSENTSGSKFGSSSQDAFEGKSPADIAKELGITLKPGERIEFVDAKDAPPELLQQQSAQSSQQAAAPQQSGSGVSKVSFG